MSAKFKLFDQVMSVGSNALRSGSQNYLYAIVVCVEPLCLISPEGDMRWNHFSRNNLKVVGTASLEELHNVRQRLSRDAALDAEQEEAPEVNIPQAPFEGFLPLGVDKSEWNFPENTERMNKLISEEMERRQWPVNPNNAARAGWYAAMRYVQENTTPVMKDHEVRELVNAVTEAAKKYAGMGQLREQLKHLIVGPLKRLVRKGSNT